jgi:hypothetical protein
MRYFWLAHERQLEKFEQETVQTHSLFACMSSIGSVTRQQDINKNVVDARKECMNKQQINFCLSHVKQSIFSLKVDVTAYMSSARSVYVPPFG